MNDIDVIVRSDSRLGYFPTFFSIKEQKRTGSPDLLLAVVGGSEAYRLSYQDPRDTAEEIMVVLRQMYGNDIPNPVDILIPTWTYDPLYRGMYSYAAIGLTVADIDTLKAPEGNLYMTGEAMSLKHFAYTHGGYCEGIATANSLLKDKMGITPTTNLPSCDNF